MADANPPWLELVQIVPVLVLAAPIIVSGTVELASLPVPFAMAAVLGLAVNGLVWQQRAVPNPIAVGTDLWLLLGAVAFAGGVPPLADLLAAGQGFALFVTITIVGAAFFPTPFGTLGARGAPRQLSVALLVLLVLATAWAWWFRADVRLGGGLPFIVCNVVRRVLIARRASIQPN